VQHAHDSGAAHAFVDLAPGLAEAAGHQACGAVLLVRELRMGVHVAVELLLPATNAFHAGKDG